VRESTSILLIDQRETVIAEKFNAMVELGMRNSRLKDYYDLWALASGFDFDGEDLSEAIRVTFARRRTPLPSEPPVALTAEFAGAAAKQTQWRAFVRRGKLRAGEASLDEVTALRLRSAGGASPFCRSTSN